MPYLSFSLCMQVFSEYFDPCAYPCAYLAYISAYLDLFAFICLNLSLTWSYLSPPELILVL